MPSLGEFLKTSALHFLLIWVYCLLYKGSFLLSYPPCLIVWILLSFLLSMLHSWVHRRYLRAYHSDWFLVRLWLEPLMYMASLLGLVLIVIGGAEALGEASWFRQIMQLPIDAFTPFLYIIFLMIFSSGTLLFLDGFFTWVPKLKFQHMARPARLAARGTLLGMVALAGLGLWFMFAQRADNLTYLKGMALQGFGRNEEAISAFSTIPKESARLWMGARFRMGVIEMKRQRRFQEALDHFLAVAENPGAPLRDEALYRAVVCLYSLEAGSEEMKVLVQRLESMHSHLWDEAMFLWIKRQIQLDQNGPALSNLKKLEGLPRFHFTVKSYLNLEATEFEPTYQRAGRERQALELRMLPALGL